MTWHVAQILPSGPRPSAPPTPIAGLVGAYGCLTALSLSGHGPCPRPPPRPRPAPSQQPGSRVPLGFTFSLCLFLVPSSQVVPETTPQ